MISFLTMLSGLASERIPERRKSVYRQRSDRESNQKGAHELDYICSLHGSHAGEPLFMDYDGPRKKGSLLSTASSKALLTSSSLPSLRGVSRSTRLSLLIRQGFR